MKSKKKQIWDEVWDYFELAYVLGVNKYAEELGFKPLESAKDIEAFDDAVKKSVEGKTAEDRVLEYAEAGDANSIFRVADTDGHRIYNAGIYANIKKAKTKTWVTMMDERVRDTHSYLEGMTIDADKPFYTYDGDYAMYPGDFALAANNINCRCELKLGF